MKGPSPPRARVVALAGGKGGVGTSLLATNLAIHLARQGREVVLLDAAPEGASLQTLMGQLLPARNLGERLAGGDVSLKDLLVAGGIPNLRLLAGVPDRPSLPPRPDDFGARLLSEAASLPADFVVADVGSGRSRAVRLACCAADMVLLVSTPEPAALRGILRLQASVLYSALEEALGAARGAELERPFAEQGLRGVIGTLREEPAPYASVLERLQRRSFALLLNQVRSSTEVEAATRIGAVLSMLQAVIVDPVITLEYDLSVLQAVRERKILSQRYPNAPVARGLEKMAFALGSPRSSEPVRGGDRHAPLSAWHHYRLLGLDPKASSREIQRHYERIRAPYLPGGEAEAIASRDRLDAVAARVEAAYRTLIFLENRREYDRRLVASGVFQASEMRDLVEEAVVSVGDDSSAAPPAEMADARSSDKGISPQATVRPALSSNPAAERTSAAGGEEARTAQIEPAPPPPTGPPATPSPPATPTAASDRGSPVPSIHDGGPSPMAEAAEVGEAVLEGPIERYSGTVLRALRLQRGLDIDRIAEATKIRAHHILSIEDERYGELPATVFVRGFLRAYARCLDLDPELVVRDYMEGYLIWSGGRG